METKDNLIKLWDAVYLRFKQLNLDANIRNMLLVMLEDLIIEISRYDIPVIRTAYIRRRFTEHADKYFFLMADVCEDIVIFTLTFVILIDVLNEFIDEREQETLFEQAANLLEVKKIIEFQKDKWITI